MIEDIGSLATASYIGRLNAYRRPSMSYRCRPDAQSHSCNTEEKIGFIDITVVCGRSSIQPNNLSAT